MSDSSRFEQRYPAARQRDSGSLRLVLPAERQDRLERVARTAFIVHARTFVVINVFLVGVWALSGAGYFWPAWVVLGWGLAIVLHAIATFGRSSSSS
jgi:hypothetical protein